MYFSQVKLVQDKNKKKTPKIIRMKLESRQIFMTFIIWAASHITEVITTRNY